MSVLHSQSFNGVPLHSEWNLKSGFCTSLTLSPPTLSLIHFTLVTWPSWWHFPHATLSSQIPTFKGKKNPKQWKHTTLPSPTRLQIFKFSIQDFIVSLDVSQSCALGIFPFLTPTESNRIMLSLQKVHFYHYGCIYIAISTSKYPYICIFLFNIFSPNYMPQCRKLLSNVFKFIHKHAHVFIEVFLYNWSVVCILLIHLTILNYNTVQNTLLYLTMSISMACKSFQGLVS